MPSCLAEPLFKLIGAWILSSGVVGFFAMGLDKARAINSEWRIPEVTLFTASFIGGSFGVLLGAFVFHHKTSKLEFMLVVLAGVGVWLFLLSRIGFLNCLQTTLAIRLTAQ